jgi:uncharacterized protein (DUF488 family)
MPVQPAVWTIGHSNHTFERFAALLGSQRIELVVDVRSQPYSRFAPQFSRPALETALRNAGVGYLFLGVELGGRPSREDHYDERGHARYDLMAEQPAFHDAIERVAHESHKRRLALLCSESQPRDCHRRLLVGKVLAEHGVPLRHILPNGHVSQEDAVELGVRYAQATLFGEEAAWTSTQSVSHRRPLSTSSAA